MALIVLMALVPEVVLMSLLDDVATAVATEAEAEAKAGTNVNVDATQCKWLP